MLIDNHCHLEPGDFPDRDEVLARARAAGVEGFVVIGSGKSLDEVHHAVALAEAHGDIWAGVGIHPHDAARIPAGALEEIERLATTHPRVVVVGETGLDYHYQHSPREAQQAALRAFIGIARRAGKPISLHIRNAGNLLATGSSEAPRLRLADAHDDALAIINEERAGELGGVVHCFTGDRADAERWVAAGLHLSFSGVVTFKSAAPIREAAAWCPLDRMLVETDCPYLAPVPLRGKRNEPSYVTHTAALLAEIRGIPPESLARATTDNARRLFRLRSPNA